jgi:TonB family protein
MSDLSHLPSRHRRRGAPREIWFVAFGVAVLVHLLLFLFWPTRDIEPLEVRTPDQPLYLSVGVPEVTSLGRERIPVVEILPDTSWVPPRVWNEAFLQRTLAREWPRDLWSWGEGGRATVALVVTAAGQAGEPRLVETSGDEAVDRAFLALADRMRFSPARLQGVAREVEAEVSLFVSPPAATVNGPGDPH